MKNIDAGIRYMLLASLLLAFMAYFVRELSLYMSSLEVVFFRNIFGVLIILATFFKAPMNSKGGKPWLLIFRGAIGTTALMMYFYNIFHMPLADAITFTKTSPIFTAVFAYFALKERLPGHGRYAVVLGFLGILFIVKPTGEIDLKLVITGILSGAFAAMAYTSIRELKNYYESRIIVMSFTLTGAVVPAILMVLGSYIETDLFDFMVAEFVMPEGVMWFHIVGMGLMGTLGQFMITKAYSATKAGVVAAISYTNILFAAIVGQFLGDPFPDTYTLTGIALVVIAGIWISKK